MRYHLIGIGGKGMSSIGQYLKVQGHEVSGSDRDYDQQKNMVIFNKLMAQGIKMFTQEGQVFNAGQPVDRVIISSAIERNNYDLLIAEAQGIPVVRRAVLLAEIFNESSGIAVGGTSGKTTVTGMLGTIMQEAGLKPTVFLGGELSNNFQPWLTGNLLIGDSKLMCIEADESDGTIIHYRPQIGLVTNISKDHQEVAGLIPLFQKFVGNIAGALVINGDCVNSARLWYPKDRVITFGFSDRCLVQAREIITGRGMIKFTVNGVKFQLKQWGLHNVANALAATGAALAMGLTLRQAAAALGSFAGIKRRLELVGEKEGVSFFDDYAHNPSKIQACINALQDHFTRLVIIFQCHGYQPTIFMWHELIETFARICRSHDLVIFSKIYDAGGTADRSISAAGLAEELKSLGIRAIYLPDRGKIKDMVKRIIVPGDGVLVMGARDETLNRFAEELCQLHTQVINEKSF